MDIQYDGDLKIDVEEYKKINDCERKIAYLIDKAKNLYINYSDDIIKIILDFYLPHINQGFIFQLIIDNKYEQSFLETLHQLHLVYNQTKVEFNELEKSVSSLHDILTTLSDLSTKNYKMYIILLQIYNKKYIEFKCKDLHKKIKPYYKELSDHYTNLLVRDLLEEERKDALKAVEQERKDALDALVDNEVEI